MDWTQILTAVLGVAGTVIAVVFGNRKTKDMLNYRMDQVEVKLDKHNHFGDRIITVEAGLDNVCKRVDKLERKE